MKNELLLLKDAAREEGWYKFPVGSKQRIAYDLACVALNKKPEPKKAPVKKKPATKKGKK